MNIAQLALRLPLLIALTSAPLLRAQTPPAPQAPPGGGRGFYGGSPIAPKYPVAYATPKVADIQASLERVRIHLDAATPSHAVHRDTGEVISDFSTPAPDAVAERDENHTIQLIAYEQGVTYAAMLNATEVTGDKHFADYTAQRFALIKYLLPAAQSQGQGQAQPQPGTGQRSPFRALITPRTLDDAGATCAALIKARRANVGPDLLPQIETLMGHISTRQFRLADGTLARRDPQPETLWLDDLYMSVPALAQMGKLTGDIKYYDDAVKQITQFSARMFNPQKGVYMHGWTANTEDHPEFYWARANGWAFMAMAELLDVLPEDHPGRAAVLKQFRAHAKGLAALQSGEGRWHNLLDRADSYLETSASAMYVFAYARGINRGWLNPVSYGPATQLGWNAVSAQINAKGEIEDVCVGTGMGFDPAFYYYRPRSVTALHGYGPVILAGAEVIRMVQNDRFNINPPQANATQFVPKPASP